MRTLFMIKKYLSLAVYIYRVSTCLDKYSRIKGRTLCTMRSRLHPSSVAGKPWPEFVQVNVGPAWTEEEAMRAQYAGPTRKSHERATAWHRFTNGSLNLLAYTLDQKVKDWQCPICECLLRSCEINGEIVDFKQHICL